MYSLALIVLLAAAGGLVVLGGRRRRRGLVAGGVVLGVAAGALFWLMGFWAEMLWFEALGQGGRFWREIAWRVGTIAGSAALAGLLALALTWSFRGRWVVRGVAIGIAAAIGLAWGEANWQAVALYVHQASTGMSDPVFARPVSFYLFTLPLYDALYVLAMWVVVISLGVSIVATYVRVRGANVMILGYGPQPLETRSHTLGSFYVAAAALLAVWAWGQYLNRYHLLYSQWGAVAGAGWTDVYVRLPGYWITCVVTAAIALVLLIAPVRRRLIESRIRRRLENAQMPPAYAHLGVLVSAVVVGLLVQLLAVGVAPGLMQWLRVEPNEITFEKPFIASNIRFTRHAYRLDNAEEREFPATGRLTPRTVDANRRMFDNIRLWDYRALSQVYSQFQEIRLYYEFADVDIDRYTIDGRYRQVMISARELELSNLPSASQTFVNRHFKYTHGNGVTLTTVSDFTPEGLPDLLIKDIPPVSRRGAPEVTQPRIYYGELTDDYVIADSREEEFDYPRGRQNVYSHYEGTGGVLMSSFWRRLIYGWKLGGTRLLLSGYPTAESRVMFRRNIRRRARALAPFLAYDSDPYVVLIDGRLHWILDAYTTSSRFPYSEQFDPRGMADYAAGRGRDRPAGEIAHLDGVNYVRNSVKVVIDAYEGSVRFYVMEPDDPVIRTWMNVFPDLFTPGDEMPEAVRRHIRYPVGMLLVQGLVYAKYHMTDPEVFYNQEDLWVRATEKYYGQVQSVEPYYIMWNAPDSDALEYVLMLPFTPKNKQVLIGWIAGMCDGENYGRFLAYRFPKEQRLLGPQQVETKIDQDPHLSGQLTLWDQRGSKVIRGNVLAIPVAGALLYVEPIYIQAETAAYPELRLVVVMHNDRLSYAESFDGALEALFAEGRPTPGTLPSATAPAPPGTTGQLIRRANRAFEDYLRLTGEGEFDEASRALRDLQDALEQLSANTSRSTTAPE